MMQFRHKPLDISPSDCTSGHDMLRTAGPDDFMMGPLAAMKVSTRLLLNKMKIECVDRHKHVACQYRSCRLSSSVSPSLVSIVAAASVCFVLFNRRIWSPSNYKALNSNLFSLYVNPVLERLFKQKQFQYISLQ
jgi:hypothetical protein